MKFSLVAVSAAFFVLSTAQNLSGLPKCAQTCVGSSLGGCNPLDIKCICSNKAFITSISCCIAGKCSAADQKATINFANQICAVAQVTLPQAAGCSATPTGSAISNSTMVSSTSTSSSVTTKPSSTKTAASAVSTSPTSGANIKSTTSSTAGSSSASSSSAKPASTSGAAGHLGLDSAMGAAGLAAAAFALL